jgi:hypothetical protein
MPCRLLLVAALAACLGCQQGLFTRKKEETVRPQDPPVGSKCKIETVQPLHQGKAIEGKIIRVTDKEFVVAGEVEERRNMEQGNSLLDRLSFGQKITNSSPVKRVALNNKEIHLARKDIANWKILAMPLPAPASDPPAGSAAKGVGGSLTSTEAAYK